MTKVTGWFVATVIAVTLAGCNTQARKERQDAVRLASFISERHEAYTQALKREAEAVADVGAAIPLARRSAESQCERLRQRILVPKQTYKYFHNQLKVLRLSTGIGRKTQREILTHLKKREVALLRFTTLLQGASDSFASLPRSVMPPQVTLFRQAVAEHDPPRDHLGELLRELCARYKIDTAQLPQSL